MTRAGVGASTAPATEAAAREASARAMEQAGAARADLALVFATADHRMGYGSLLAQVRATTGATHVVGCSSFGIVTADAEVERQPGVAVMALASDTITAVPFFMRGLRARNAEVGRQIGRSLKDAMRGTSLLLLFPDTFALEAQALFGGIHEELGAIAIAGGGASEDGTLGQTFQMCGDLVDSNAAVGVLLSGGFSYAVGITQGCQPIGRPRVVTRARGNTILELDGRPAFEALAEAVGPALLRDLQRLASSVFIGLPADPRRPAFEAGEFVVRNLVGLDPRQGALALGEEVHEGHPVTFTLREPTRAREDLRRTLEGLRARLGEGVPRVGLYFNCCGRGSSLYRLPDIDSAYINLYFRSLPLIGFFTYAEIAPTGGQTLLHQYTGVLVLLGD